MKNLLNFDLYNSFINLLIKVNSIILFKLVFEFAAIELNGTKEENIHNKNVLS